MTTIISLDGNIGSGKTTFLDALASRCPDYEIVLEPVGEWASLMHGNKSLLELFYEDKSRWAYTFQSCAILTRAAVLKGASASSKKRVIITERSVLTDRFVFAEMLRASGDINDIEWNLYMKMYNEFAASLPIAGIIYLTTSIDTSAQRIVQRGRSGEAGITRDYLRDLDLQHQNWVQSTTVPVLRLSTEPHVSVEDNVAAVVQFIQKSLPLV